ncbi:hypothetical protein GCM10022389_08910 [Flavobacterium cheonanense]|uniref:DUF1493 family protein n=1 Tax=Flavobacterium cheonanense TaxID=706183 RepID=A0ABP7VG03_9FLAO
MILEEEIINFIEKEFWKSNLNSDSDVFKEVRIDGDDCEELLVKYSEKYSVDMNNFLWYFHYQEEGSLSFSIGNLFFKNPRQRVKEIPITPKMLTEFANSKKWTIDYPEHKLPKHRYDIFINRVLIISIIIIIILVKI